jgi:hypothetical protein
MIETPFQITLAINRNLVNVQVQIPHGATQTARQVIFELLAGAFASVESVDTQVIRTGLLSGIDEILTREDSVVLQRHYASQDYIEKLEAALRVSPSLSISIH